MEFGSIKYVTSGLSLVAFLAAVVLAIYRAHLGRETNTIKTVYEVSRDSAAREKLIGLILERFAIDTQGMSSRHKMELATKQIVERRRRLGILCLFASFAFVCGLVVSALVVLR